MLFKFRKKFFTTLHFQSMSQTQTFAVAPTCFGIQNMLAIVFLTSCLQTRIPNQFPTIRRVEHGLIRKG